MIRSDEDRVPAAPVWIRLPHAAQGCVRGADRCTDDADTP